MKKNKIKIAYVIPKLHYGGAEQHVLDILKISSKKNLPLEKHLILLRPSSYKLENKIIQNVKIITLNFKKFISFNTLKQIMIMKNYFKENSIDIVHTHTNDPDFFGTLSAHLASVPIVISTEHTQSQFRIRTSMQNLIHRIKDYIRLRYTDCVIVISKGVLDFFYKHTRFSENKIIFIHNGINIDKFRNAEPNITIKNNKKLKLALIGRFDEMKGHNFIIKLLNKHRDLTNKYHIYFIGEGYLRNEIEKNIINYNLTPHITLLGTINWIPSFLKSIDALIMPSLWEGLPLVALESLASGTPVIGNNVDGINEIIQNNFNGYIIEKNNYTIWYNTLKNITKKDLEILGMQGQIFVDRKFNYQIMMDNLYLNYTKLINYKYY